MASFREFVAESLAVVGPVTIRSMFGGAGVYRDGAMFGLIADDTLYFKVDDATRPRFEAEGSGPFTYMTRNGSNTIATYWRVPERLFEDADELAQWAGDAIAIAERLAARKPKAKPVKTERSPPNKPVRRNPG